MLSCFLTLVIFMETIMNRYGTFFYYINYLKLLKIGNYPETTHIGLCTCLIFQIIQTRRRSRSKQVQKPSAKPETNHNSYNIIHFSFSCCTFLIMQLKSTPEINTEYEAKVFTQPFTYSTIRCSGHSKYVPRYI